MKVYLFSSLLASLSTLVASQADNCTVNCEQGSECKLGDADWGDQPKDINDVSFEFHKETNRDGWYCECPDEWTGIRCGRKYEICEGTEHYCYHGGKCIDGLSDKVSAEDLFCDCSDAQHDGVPYVGKWCEVEGGQKCADDSDVFCTNGGTCVADFEDKRHPCECPTGHRGPQCEFDTGHVPDCVLTCENSGSCMLGIKTYEQAAYSNFWALHDGNFQYCECPDGYFGPTCETSGQVCGDEHCFNGASCLETLDSTGASTYACDCVAAATNEESFAGEYCHTISTTFCTKEADQNGHLFCANGGTCKENSHEGCECPDGFHGPICEFKDLEEEAACSLTCENDGKCRKGKKDNQLIEQFGEDLQAFSNATHLGLWEHCVCPDGFFGIQCEHQLEICPGGDHVCLHGSKCVAEDETKEGDTSHKCDCDHGFDAVEKYAGKFCQYTSTDICTRNGRPGVGKANFAFCVNNGRCVKKVDDTEEHPGCICDSGFTGDHCEFLEGQDPEDTQSAPSATTVQSESTGFSPSGGLVIALAVALLVLVAVIATALVKKLASRSEIEKKNGLPAPVPKPERMQTASEPSGPTPFEGEDTFMDAGDMTAATDSDMKTVEII